MLSAGRPAEYRVITTRAYSAAQMAGERIAVSVCEEVSQRLFGSCFFARRMARRPEGCTSWSGLVMSLARVQLRP